MDVIRPSEARRDLPMQEYLDQLEAQRNELLAALKAAEQFLDPSIPRGPDVNGWANTRELVDAAIAKAEGR